MTAAASFHPVPLAGPVGAMRVVRSEWTKFRSVRSTWWTLATSTLLTIGIGVAATAAAAGERTSSSLPDNVATRAMLGTIFAQLALGTLAVLMMAGEYGTGMIRSSMAVVPRRLPVLWGKLVVYGAVVLPLSLLTSAATFLLGQLIWRGHGRPPVSFADAHVRQVLVGASLYITLAGVCALAIATAIRSTAGGITVVIGLFFVLPTVLQAMPARRRPGSCLPTLAQRRPGWRPHRSPWGRGRVSRCFAATRRFSSPAPPGGCTAATSDRWDTRRRGNLDTGRTATIAPWPVVAVRRCGGPLCPAGVGSLRHVRSRPGTSGRGRADRLLRPAAAGSPDLAGSRLRRAVPARCGDGVVGDAGGLVAGPGHHALHGRGAAAAP